MRGPCTKCGHEVFTLGLRQVRLTVGWEHCTMQCVAPVTMCQRCGNLQVFIRSEIGELVNTPEPATVGPVEPAQEPTPVSVLAQPALAPADV
jgi:hypothetical protein